MAIITLVLDSAGCVSVSARVHEGNAVVGAGARICRGGEFRQSSPDSVVAKIGLGFVAVLLESD